MMDPAYQVLDGSVASGGTISAMNLIRIVFPDTDNQAIEDRCSRHRKHSKPRLLTLDSTEKGSDGVLSV